MCKTKNHSKYSLNNGKRHSYAQLKTEHFSGDCFINSPVHLLEEFAKDEDWQVRRAVTENPNTPEHILFLLLHDVEWRVRSSVILNNNISKEMLNILAKSEVETVREEAQRRLKEITQ